MKTRVCPKPGHETIELRRVAEELARRQNEPSSTLHVLLAVALRSGPAADLLVERGVTAEALMAAQIRTDPHKDSLERVFARAAETAADMNEDTPSAIHVLVALLSEGNTAARRALMTQRVDPTHLRAAAMHVGLGWVGQRRLAMRSQANVAPAAKVPTGVTIPLFGATPSRQGARDARSAATRDRRAQIIPIMAPRSPDKEAATRPSEPPPSVRQQSQPVAEAPRHTPRRTKRPHAAVEQLDPKQFPMLSTFGIHLSAMAARGELDPVTGREREIENVLDVLAKRHGNNPVLVGHAGVGKTSVVRGLAQRLAESATAGSADDRIVIEISIPEFLAGTGVRGALAQRMVALHQEVKRAAGRIVVFFDEIHQLFSGDAAEELGGELKLALARGELPCIGATTVEGYQRTIDADPALARRFSVVEVDEPSPSAARSVLDVVAERLHQHHGVSYDAGALDDCLRWTVRYLPGRQLPDKAVSVLDLAGARARRRASRSVTRQAVAEVVASIADMPIERLTESDRERYLQLEQLIADKVVGHQAAITKIARILRRNAAGLGSKRPLGTFLLLGPTGVGKTETAKALASTLFHSETATTRIDMAEYSEPHSVARLIGAPPGYVGHDAGGQLTEAVRRRPYQIVLLDEIEKAHQDVLQSFLSVFDEGRMTDGRGRTVDFTNTVILMTSNLGSDHTAARPKRRVGFGAEQIVPSQREAESGVIAAARARLSPELYNRIDEVLVFEPLSRDEVREVARRLLARTAEALVDRQIELRIDEGAIDWLLENGGYDISLGARPMKRTVARFVEAPLAEQILGGALVSGMSAHLRAIDGQLKIIALQ
jgi:ATP-dependent Clp protease ATP-binding subunit ClpC